MMAILNLTGQALERNDVAPKLAKLKALMEQRKEIWQKASAEKREQWIKSDKDPILSIAFDVWRYLNKEFYGPQWRKIELID